MGRLGLAIKMFFKILTDAEAAQQVQTTTEDSTPKLPKAEKTAPEIPPVESARSEALTLLETLQREARLIDFLNEDLSSYQDAQVGAAVREVHRGCQDVLNRCFQIEANLDIDEGGSFEVNSETNPAAIRLVGNVVDKRPLSGTVVHSGWKAKKCELPKWNGEVKDELIIAPAEVEIA